jgi:hypothetical protein
MYFCIDPKELDWNLSGRKHEVGSTASFTAPQGRFIPGRLARGTLPTYFCKEKKLLRLKKRFTNRPISPHSGGESKQRAIRDAATPTWCCYFDARRNRDLSQTPQYAKGIEQFMSTASLFTPRKTDGQPWGNCHYKTADRENDENAGYSNRNESSVLNSPCSLRIPPANTGILSPRNPRKTVRPAHHLILPCNIIIPSSGTTTAACENLPLVLVIALAIETTPCCSAGCCTTNRPAQKKVLNRHHLFQRRIYGQPDYRRHLRPTRLALFLGLPDPSGGCLSGRGLTC